MEVEFSIGKYDDTILCDVMPMEACYLLLGRPWNLTRKLCMMVTPRSSLLYIKNAILLLHLCIQEKLVRINKKWEIKENKREKKKGKKVEESKKKRQKHQICLLKKRGEKDYAFEKPMLLLFNKDSNLKVAGLFQIRFLLCYMNLKMSFPKRCLVVYLL